MAKPLDDPGLRLHHVAIEGLAAAHTAILSNGRTGVVTHALPAARDG
jgi:hypothetical protein